MIESLLLTATRVSTFEQQRALTNASSFFFERDERLFLVTSRHVMIDEPSRHFPDRIEIELHTDPDNLAKSTGFSIPLYRNGKSLWRQGIDSTAAHSDGYSPRCSCTIRTARSRTSGENLFDLFMAPFSQKLEPPQNPGRFISVSFPGWMKSSFTPFRQVHSSRALDVNSVPRSRVIELGAPWHFTQRSSALATSRPER